MKAQHNARQAKGPPAASARKAKGPPTAELPSDCELRLYVAGASPKSVAAFRNLEQLCEKHVPGKYRIKVIDLTKEPQLAQGDQILAVPTVVRKLPSPIHKVIGDLSNTERVLVGLDLRPSEADPFASRKAAPDA